MILFQVGQLELNIQILAYKNIFMNVFGHHRVLSPFCSKIDILVMFFSYLVIVLCRFRQFFWKKRNIGLIICTEKKSAYFIYTPLFLTSSITNILDQSVSHRFNTELASCFCGKFRQVFYILPPAPFTRPSISSQILYSMPCKAKRQYLLTLQASRYCPLVLQSSTHQCSFSLPDHLQKYFSKRCESSSIIRYLKLKIEWGSLTIF